MRCSSPFHIPDPHNAFMGTSEKAYASNLRFHLKAVFHYMMLEANENILLLAENPAADMRHHPLTISYIDVR